MSTPTAGNFDCARLQEIKTDLASLYSPKNELHDPDLIADVAPLKMIMDIQTVKITALEDPTKDHMVKGTFMIDCDEEAPTDCTETCEIDGPEIGTLCKDYELDLCFQKSFSVFERKFRTLGNEVNQNMEVAVNLGRKLKLMDEHYAGLAVSALDSMSGLNLYSGEYTVAADATTIPAAAWNPDLFPYFAVAKSRNRLPSMKLLLGGLMERALVKAELESETEAGRANIRKIKSLGNVYTDSFVTEAKLGYKAAFLVSPSALGVATKAYHSPYGAGREEIADGNKQVLYTITSPNTGIVYDVTYQVSCVVVNGLKDWKHTWEIKTKGGFLTSPSFCNTNRTGVLQFKCG